MPFAAGKGFRQRLSLYDAEARVAGESVELRCFVAAQTDVLVLEIDDERAEPQPVRVTLSMWRAPEVVHGNHAARYRFSEADDSVAVVQSFDEKDYHCVSAVAVCVDGEETEVQRASERSRSVLAPAKRGKRLIFIASAALLGSDNAAGKNTAGDMALSLLKAVGQCSYEHSLEQHLRWWHDFWARTFVRLRSKDGSAEAAQNVRYRHLYYMASSSRGALPPKWNGSLFATAGDERGWGSQFWVWTTEMLYFPLLKADAIDLTDPYFDMYVRQLANCEKAARQRWGSRGACFPETTSFDGPTVLPDDVAAEFQDVLLRRKKHTELSPRAAAMCRFDSHLRASTSPREGRYTWISHVASSGSELAVQAWWRYRYTGDTRWLRTHAYPLLRGAVEFYRHLVEKGEDGRYHLSGTNSHEDFWGVQDGIMDLAAIRGTVPPAIARPRFWMSTPSCAASGESCWINWPPIRWAMIQNGKVEFVEIESRLGEECRLRNPWGGECVASEVGGLNRVLIGELLRFETTAGRRYRVFPRGTPPSATRPGRSPTQTSRLAHGTATCSHYKAYLPQETTLCLLDKPFCTSPS